MAASPSPVADVPRILCVPEVAKLLGCTQTHVARSIESRRLEAFNLAGEKEACACNRVPVRWLEKFLASSVVI